MQIAEGSTHVRSAVARKEAKDNRIVAREKTEPVGLVVKQDTLQRGVIEVDLQAWCLLEESENEQ